MSDDWNATTVIGYKRQTAKVTYSKDTDRDGWIQVNYEEFLKVRLSVS